MGVCSEVLLPIISRTNASVNVLMTLVSLCRVYMLLHHSLARSLRTQSRRMYVPAEWITTSINGFWGQPETHKDIINRALGAEESGRHVDATQKLAAWRQKNNGFATNTNKKQRSLTGHSIGFVLGHSGSLEVTRGHFGHSLHGDSTHYALNAHVHISKMLEDLYTRSHQSSKSWCSGYLIGKLKKVSGLTLI